MSIDLTPVAEDKPAAERKTIMPHTAIATVTHVQTGTSPKKGTPYLELTWQFTEGEFRGFNLWEKYYTTEKALWKLERTCTALGVEWPGVGGQLDENLLIGKSARLRTDQEVWPAVFEDDGVTVKYPARPNPTVAWIEAIDDSNATPVPPSAPAGQMVDHVPASAIGTDDDSIPFAPSLI